MNNLTSFLINIINMYDVVRYILLNLKSLMNNLTVIKQTSLRHDHCLC
jgi:hypothetical protein